MTREKKKKQLNIQRDKAAKPTVYVLRLCVKVLM